MTTKFELAKALLENKKAFRVSKDGETRICLAKSIEQCKGKFKKWDVYEISIEEYTKEYFGE